MKPFTVIVFALGVASAYAGGPSVLSAAPVLNTVYYSSAPVPQYSYGAPAIAAQPVGRIIQRVAATPPILSTPISAPLAIPAPQVRVVSQPQVIAQPVVQQVAVAQPQLIATPQIAVAQPQVLAAPAPIAYAQAPVVQQIAAAPAPVQVTRVVAAAAPAPVQVTYSQPIQRIQQIIEAPTLPQETFHVVSSPQLSTQIQQVQEVQVQQVAVAAQPAIAAAAVPVALKAPVVNTVSTVSGGYSRK